MYVQLLEMATYRGKASVSVVPIASRRWPQTSPRFRVRFATCTQSGTMGVKTSCTCWHLSRASGGEGQTLRNQVYYVCTLVWEYSQYYIIHLATTPLALYRCICRTTVFMFCSNMFRKGCVCESLAHPFNNISYRSNRLFNRADPLQ